LISPFLSAADAAEKEMTVARPIEVTRVPIIFIARC